MDLSLFAEENRLKRGGIYERLFRITERLNRKLVWLYGLNEDTKQALVFLAHFGITVEGFLLKKGQEALNGICYIGCPVISSWEFQRRKQDSCVVLDIYGKNIPAIRNALPAEITIEILFETTERHIAIYGAGHSGRCFYDLCQRCGIEVDFFIDQRSASIGGVEGCPVISPDELDSRDKDCFIAIAIDDQTAAKEVREMLFHKMFQKTDLFDSFFWERCFTKEIWAKRGKEYQRVFAPQVLYSLRRLLQKKKVYLFGNDIRYLADVASVLRNMGLMVSYAVSCVVEDEVQVDYLKIYNAWSLIHEEPSGCAVYVPRGEDENVRHFLKASGIQKELFVGGSGSIVSFGRVYSLDTHIGYTNSMGPVTVRNCPVSDRSVKIGILGNSTSDWDLLCEKSWPECLLESAKRQGIKMECLCHATSGNISAMELIRLERDLLWEKPDIVISYSRACESLGAVENHRFTNCYQRAVFEKIVHEEVDLQLSWRTIVGSYSMGAEVDDIAGMWLGNERMMHAVCEEFGIHFYAFLQPLLFEKKPRTVIDMELMEHLSDLENPGGGDRELADNVQKEIERYPWLYDFTEIFDGVNEEIYMDSCHVFERGNRLVAEKILSVLMENEDWGEQR